MRWIVAFVLALAALVVRPGLARAHDLRSEAVFLDLGERAVAVELEVPLFQLRAAAPELFPTAGRDLTSLDVAAVPAYVRPRLGAVDGAGRRFRVDVTAARVEQRGDDAIVLVRAVLEAPAGSDARRFELHDDVVLERVVTHAAYVFVRRDLRAGALGESLILAGQLDWQARSLVVDRSAGSAASVAVHAFSLGTHHIAEGADHVLFLLLLLCAVTAGSAQKGARQRAFAVAKLVTAFTIGHSATLALSTFLRFESGRLVESLVAASIAVTAVHVVRPLFPRREALVAAGFGLVHGLAFASALVPFGFDGRALALSLLGFNLGVEAMQLAVVSVTAPLLALLAAGPSWRAVQSSVAAFGLVTSLSWIAERAAGVTLPAALSPPAIATRAPWLLGALVVVVVVDRALAGRPTSERDGQEPV